jgi:hypothetical protein
MLFRTFFRYLRSNSQRDQVFRSHQKDRRPKCAKSSGGFRPFLEILEDRTVLSVLAVTSAADDGSAGTLRAVLASAQNGDTIRFARQLNGQTITLTQGELAIHRSLGISGPGGTKLPSAEMPLAVFLKSSPTPQ